MRFPIAVRLCDTLRRSAPKPQEPTPDTTPLPDTTPDTPTDTITPDTATDTSTSPDTTTDPKPDGSLKTLLIVGGVILGALILFFAIFFPLRKKQ